MWYPTLVGLSQSSTEDHKHCYKSEQTLLTVLEICYCQTEGEIALFRVHSCNAQAH